jgi:hypothetical protein
MMTFARGIIARRLTVGALGIQLLSATCNLSAGNAAKVDQLFAQWDRADSPGAAVVVVKDGAVVYLHGYWSEELRVVTRLEIHDGSLAVCLRSGRWIRLLPTGADRFDAEYGGIAIQFTRNATAEVTEVKLSGSRVRNLRHIRVALPRT